jgi:non-heme chloroperoxidase
LVYLEAGYPYAFDNGTGPSMQDFQAITGPQPPPPSERELASFGSLRDYYVRTLGFSFPQAELRQQRTAGPDGRVGKTRDFPGYQTLLSGLKKYADIRVPSLWVYALPHTLGKWIDNASDPKVRERAKTYEQSLTALTERQVQAVETGLPSARVVKLRGGHHYIYLSNEADVLREMRSFIAGLH